MTSSQDIFRSKNRIALGSDGARTHTEKKQEHNIEKSILAARIRHKKIGL